VRNQLYKLTLAKKNAYSSGQADLGRTSNPRQKNHVQYPDVKIFMSILATLIAGSMAMCRRTRRMVAPSCVAARIEKMLISTPDISLRADSFMIIIQVEAKRDMFVFIK
jgi:hypothetical protein